MLSVSTSFSNGGGGHIIGSTLPLSETWFTTSDEQAAVIDSIANSKSLANQVWVLGMTVSSAYTILSRRSCVELNKFT